MSLLLAVSVMRGLWALGHLPHILGGASPCKLEGGGPRKLGGALALQTGGVAPAAANASLDASSVDAASNAFLDVSPTDMFDPIFIHQG